ncbi:MAG: 16S rRNA (cytosine(967)-C(5))-methyltransferase RsmB [Nitrosomonas sp.]|nr:16S rRNA (cytosine(967)-C(5))-methyltransferase RsmB [Nitrosomonas sp.]
MIKTQLEAATIIKKVLTGTSLTSVLQTTWRANPALSSQQRGAIQDLSYGVLRFYGQLDALLALLLKKSLNDIRIRYLLLVGLYQLQYSKAPPHAVVDHAVSAARSLNGSKWIQGLVNAVLRNFLRQRAKLLNQVMVDEVARYSHPQWWIDKLRLQYPNSYQKILKANNQRPSMTLRVNRQKIDVDEYLSLLDENGLSEQRLWDNAVKLIKPVAVEKLPGFSAGLVSIQDAGAQLAAPFLDAHNGMRVLDACAAPGGKSTHLLEMADIALTVLDNDPERLARVEQNLKRIKVKATKLICGDAAQPAQWWDGKPFDRILADVPCSASGVVCRHPDIKWLRRESDLQNFSTNQQKILNALWSILKKRGKLLYATCSIFAEENKLQIEAFLSQHPNARQLPLDQTNMIKGQLLPSSQHDGFFYALLQKY